MKRLALAAAALRLAGAHYVLALAAMSPAERRAELERSEVHRRRARAAPRKRRR